MAYKSVTITLSAAVQNTQHKGGSGGATVAGDVYVAWDTTNVTTLTQLRQSLRRAAELAALAGLGE